MVEILLFDVLSIKNKALDDIRDMHLAQGVKDASVEAMLEPTALPQVGFISYHAYELTPICAGFLRLVEGGYGQIDTLVTNPHLPGAIRHLGVSKVVEALIARAKEFKMHGLICLTKDAGILKRAESLGFKVLDQTPIVLKL